ncbi:MAG: BBP7 family outer membrane beta-barrel protein [Planctomycetia bacterium]|nr:BBP7 family outer membrane beta-barrel protein [Planctomycetia bacterium]
MSKKILGALGVSLVSALCSQAEPALPLSITPPPALVVQAESAPAPAPTAAPPMAPAEAAAPSPHLHPNLYGQPAVDCNAIEESCGPRFWASAEYLLWWIKPADSPLPLVTTGSEQDPIPGGLGQPNTVIIFGADNLNYNAASGLRLSAGYWFNDSATFGIEGSYFVLERRSVSFQAAADGTGRPLIARPIVSAVDNGLNTELTSLPDSGFTGSLNIRSDVRFQGWELNAVLAAFRDAGLKADLVGGFRTLDLNEGLTFQDVLIPVVDGGFTFLGNGVSVGDIATDFDKFHTKNKFYGLQLGGRVEWQGERLSVGVLGKLAFGTTQQLLRISGDTGLLSPTTGFAAVPGGVLAQITNIGEYYHDSWSFIPELGINLNYQLTPSIRLLAGYSILWWNNVLRPAEQIDGVVNRFLVPTDQVFGTGTAAARPTLLGFQESDFWAQGFNFGVHFQY